MPYRSGLDHFEEIIKIPVISSGDATLDRLLFGGFRKDFIYLLYGDRKIISIILMKSAVLVFKNRNFTKKVAFVDGNNRFNPYKVSKFALSQNISPKHVLENIVITRAFTYDQMIELLEHRMLQLDHIQTVIISGITRLWPNYDQKTFEELQRALQGIKDIMQKLDSIIIITAPLHPYFEIKPVGGHNLTHFGHVLILIEDKGPKIEYSLIQYPSLPESTLMKWKPLPPKKEQRHATLNLTLEK